jgi:hypothetical protein
LGERAKRLKARYHPEGEDVDSAGICRKGHANYPGKSVSPALGYWRDALAAVHLELANPMIDIQQFQNIKRKHGLYASWAVWADASEKPKSNMGDVSHFKNESVLSLLKNNIVMVGLNISRPVSEPFINFHDRNPRANDFKIRYAFKDSAYYGAYMTDIIKFREEVNSKNVMKYLKEHPEVIEENLEIFREEMQDLKAEAPVILAFGKDTHTILSENLNKNEYRKLIKLTHYSHQIGKEAYKEAVFKEIGSSFDASG